MKIIKDIKAYSDGSFIKAIMTIMINPYFHMCFWYRIAHAFSLIHFSLISKIIMYFNRLIYSCDIDYRCSIGGGLKILHGTGIVIGKGVIIGNNVSIYQGVTLGGNFGKSRIVNGKKYEFPVIEDNVKLLTKCSVFGPCVVGRGSIVGAHTVITKDVSENQVIYNKQTLISRDINV